VCERTLFFFRVAKIMNKLIFISLLTCSQAAEKDALGKTEGQVKVLCSKDGVTATTCSECADKECDSHQCELYDNLGYVHYFKNNKCDTPGQKICSHPDEPSPKLAPTCGQCKKMHNICKGECTESVDGRHCLENGVGPFGAVMRLKQMLCTSDSTAGAAPRLESADDVDSGAGLGQRAQFFLKQSLCADPEGVSNWTRASNDASRFLCRIFSLMGQVFGKHVQTSFGQDFTKDMSKTYAQVCDKKRIFTSLMDMVRNFLKVKYIVAFVAFVKNSLCLDESSRLSATPPTKTREHPEKRGTPEHPEDSRSLVDRTNEEVIQEAFVTFLYRTPICGIFGKVPSAIFSTLACTIFGAHENTSASPLYGMLTDPLLDHILGKTVMEAVRIILDKSTINALQETAQYECKFSEIAEKEKDEGMQGKFSNSAPTNMMISGAMVFLIAGIAL